LTDEDRWRRSEPSKRGPSTPTDVRFSPIATGLGVFVAVAIPIFVVGYTRPAGTNTTIIVLGVVIGVVAGLIVGIWVAHRDGRIWRGPQL
jgi:high-affinity Fe2+/Pb2+ permease